MARPRKKRIELSTDSFISISQEAYNELVEQRSMAIRQINENKKKMPVEDMHDLVGLNKANTDLLKIVDSSIDKKIAIMKLMGTYILNKNSSAIDTSGSEITPEDLRMIQELMGGDKPGDNDYKIK